MLKTVPVTSREWAVFAIRWAIPLGLALFVVSSPTPLTVQQLGLIGAVAAVMIVTNLAVLLLFLSDQWRRIVVSILIVVDGLLSVAAVAVTNVSVGWVGLVPVALAGFYYGWMVGLVAGVVVAAAILFAQIIVPHTEIIDVARLGFTLLMIPSVGPLAHFLGSSHGEIEDLRDQIKVRSRRAEQVTKVATEYMRVIYEMTEILSASKLDPKRVLQSAVKFSVDALERVGVSNQIYTLILLYADGGEGVGNVLKVARASDNLRPGDYQVAVPGTEGSIAETFHTQAPALNHAPDADPELRRFESLRGCKTVLSIPLSAGNEVYGVMLVAGNETDAFREMHVEMMRAVANQAAASLNNARLYGSLIEQRDRLVEIEKTTRSQLASELHDGPTQGVAAITMRLNYIRKLIEKKPETAVDELYKIEDLARKTTKEIRHMLFELRPMALEQGLQEGLTQLAAKMQETYEQKVELAFDAQADRLLDKQTVQTLFSIATETVNNARKHAKAERILIQVGPRNEVLVMEISDNGIGFDVEAALDAAKGREGHLGLLSLQERARLVEGNLDLWSEPGQGSRTTVTIPLEVLQSRRAEEAERAAEKAV